MKTKIKLFIIGTMALALAFSACSSPDKKSTSTEQNSTNAKIIYTCSMHPEVKSNKAGECPKCGMELILSDEKLEDRSTDTSNK